VKDDLRRVTSRAGGGGESSLESKAEIEETKEGRNKDNRGRRGGGKERHKGGRQKWFGAGTY
jgi:hypothetical protein